MMFVFIYRLLLVWHFLTNDNKVTAYSTRTIQSIQQRRLSVVSYHPCLSPTTPSAVTLGVWFPNSSCSRSKICQPSYSRVLVQATSSPTSSTSSTNDDDDDDAAKDDITNSKNETPRTTLTTTTTTKQPFVLPALVSATIFIVIDIIFRRVFMVAKIAFPSSLGGCGALLCTLLVLQRFSSSTTTNFYESFLQPGSLLLAKWLPVFFVPSLVTLPLADSIGSNVEILKITSVLIGGFFLSLLATAYSVVTVRNVFSFTASKNPTTTTTTKSLSKSSVTVPSTTTTTTNTATSSITKKPFSDGLFRTMIACTISAGAFTIGAAKGIAVPSLANPISALFLLSITLTSFVFGARLPKKFTKIIHPLVTCTTITWLVSYILSMIYGTTFLNIVKTYRKGYGIRGIYNTGAGDVLLYLLGPAVVSLASSMYERRKLIRTNWKEVGTSIVSATASGLFGTAFAVRYLKIVSPYLRLSLLSRNITSPLAMSIATMLGADISLAVSFVVITGLFGANFGAAILDSIGIKDSVARGLGIGAAAHGLGTAAFVNEPDAFPFAAISMALTATAATVTVSIPFIRHLLVQIALG